MLACKVLHNKFQDVSLMIFKTHFPFPIFTSSLLSYKSSNMNAWICVLVCDKVEYILYSCASTDWLACTDSPRFITTITHISENHDWLNRAQSMVEHKDKDGNGFIKDNFKLNI